MPDAGSGKHKPGLDPGVGEAAGVAVGDRGVEIVFRLQEGGQVSDRKVPSGAGGGAPEEGGRGVEPDDAAAAVGGRADEQMVVAQFLKSVVFLNSHLFVFERLHRQLMSSKIRFSAQIPTQPDKFPYLCTDG